MKASNQMIGITGADTNKLLGLLGAKTKKSKAELLDVSLPSYYRITTSEKDKFVSDQVELSLLALLEEKFGLLGYEPRKLTEDFIGKMYGLKYRDRPKLYNQSEPEKYEAIRVRYKGLLVKRSISDPMVKKDLVVLKELFGLKVSDLIEIYKSSEIKQYIYNGNSRYSELPKVGTIRLWLSLFIYYKKVDLGELREKIKGLLG